MLLTVAMGRLAYGQEGGLVARAMPVVSEEANGSLYIVRVKVQDGYFAVDRGAAFPDGDKRALRVSERFKAGLTRQALAEVPDVLADYLDKKFRTLPRIGEGMLPETLVEKERQKIVERELKIAKLAGDVAKKGEFDKLIAERNGGRERLEETERQREKFAKDHGMALGEATWTEAKEEVERWMKDAGLIRKIQGAFAEDAVIEPLGAILMNVTAADYRAMPIRDGPLVAADVSTSDAAMLADEGYVAYRVLDPVTAQQVSAEAFEIVSPNPKQSAEEAKKMLSGLLRPLRGRLWFLREYELRLHDEFSRRDFLVTDAVALGFPIEAAPETRVQVLIDRERLKGSERPPIEIIYPRVVKIEIYFQDMKADAALRYESVRGVLRVLLDERNVRDALAKAKSSIEANSEGLGVAVYLDELRVKEQPLYHRQITRQMMALTEAEYDLSLDALEGTPIESDTERLSTGSEEGESDEAGEEASTYGPGTVCLTLRYVGSGEDAKADSEMAASGGEGGQSREPL